MNQLKKTLVIGASENKERYSNIAVNLLRQYQYPVVAIGNKVGKINEPCSMYFIMLSCVNG